MKFRGKKIQKKICGYRGSAANLGYACENLGGQGPLVWEEKEYKQTVVNPNYYGNSSCHDPLCTYLYQSTYFPLQTKVLIFKALLAFSPFSPVPVISTARYYDGFCEHPILE
jgi:hypothetical protein